MGIWFLSPKVHTLHPIPKCYFFSPYTQNTRLFCFCPNSGEIPTRGERGRRRTKEKHVGIFFSSQIFRVSQQQLHRSVTRCLSPLSDPKEKKREKTRICTKSAWPPRSGKRIFLLFLFSVFKFMPMEFWNFTFDFLTKHRRGWRDSLCAQINEGTSALRKKKHWSFSYMVISWQQSLVSAILSYPWALTLSSLQLV